MPPYLFKSFIKHVSDSRMTVVENMWPVRLQRYSMFGGKNPLSTVRTVIEDIQKSTLTQQSRSKFNAS